jgi:hypothetical protein
LECGDTIKKHEQEFEKFYFISMVSFYFYFTYDLGKRLNNTGREPRKVQLASLFCLLDSATREEVAYCNMKRLDWDF